LILSQKIFVVQIFFSCIIRAMKTQHTPGPWTYEYSNDVGDDEYFIEFYEVRTPDYKEVARVDNEADARLIAAAPEMLATLRWLTEALWDFGLGGSTARLAALAAIARAEGRA
jgi:hypothetical protein